MEEITWDALVEFIRNVTRKYKKPIDRETTLEEGLGVTGEEAAELIQQFADKFGVDTTDFIFTRYFYDEPPFFEQGGPKQPLTVGDLERAIQAGRLDESVIQATR